MTKSQTAAPERSIAADDPRQLYLDLLKNALTRYTFGETWQPYSPRPGSWRHAVFRLGRRLLRRGRVSSWSAATPSTPSDGPRAGTGRRRPTP